ncbi:MAG: Ig-like domain-containing protein [Gemmatimonadetes bacterium]|nr:Ig-like domain-containing protein [Gemmatimonadota bacterium]
MTHSKRTTSWVALAALVVSLACGGGGDGGSTTPPPPDNSPATITLSATGAVTLVSGNTLNVTANVLTRDGRPVTGASVVWSSSNAQVASVNGGLITAVLVGTTQVTASVGSVVSSPLAVTTTPGAATRLGLRTQPGGAAVGARFVTQPVVDFLDAAGNVVTTSAGAVNAAIASGGGTLAGTATVSASNGVATFSDLGMSGTIGNRTLSFSTAGLAPVTSAAFALAPGAPAAMVLRRQPVGGAVGAALLTQPIVELRDVSGNVSTGSTAVVTAGLTGFTGTVGGTVAVTAVAGVATFTNLVVSGQPGTYALAFSSTGVPGVAAAPMALPAIIFGLGNEKVQFLDAGASSTAALSTGGPAGFLSRAANRVSIDNNGRFTGVAEGQSWLLGFNNLGADSVLAVVTRSAGGPVARTTLTNYVMRTGDTTYFRLVLDPRNTPVGAFTVVVNFNSQDFSPAYQIGTRTVTGASVTAAQSDPNVFRFSVVTTTPLTAPVEFGEVLLISGPTNARLAMTVQAIEIFGPDGADLFSRVTSTFYPLVFR